MTKKQTKTPAPEPKARPTPAHFFKLVSYHEDGKGSVNPKEPTYVAGVTWFRCRAYMGSSRGVDSGKVLLELVKDLPLEAHVLVMVPDT